MEKNKDIRCPYKHKCTSYPDKCGRCKNNTGRKDYFKPETSYTPLEELIEAIPKPDKDKYKPIEVPTKWEDAYQEAVMKDWMHGDTYL